MNRRQFLGVVSVGGTTIIAGCGSEDTPINPLAVIETTNRLDRSVTVNLTINSIEDERNFEYSDTVVPINDEPIEGRRFEVSPDINNAYKYNYQIQVEDTNLEQHVSAEFLKENYVESAGQDDCLLLHWSIRNTEQIAVFLDLNESWCES